MVLTHRDIVWSEFIKWVDSIDLKDKKVLEIGPEYAFEFKDEFIKRGATWQGVDSNYTSDNVFKGVMENIPFPDKSFDYVFSCHAFEHTQHPMLSLSQIFSKCKKQFMLITPFHCRQQILEGDITHFFCLTALQMTKLFRVLGIPEIDIHVQVEGIELEQDYNLISIGGYP